MNVSLALGAPVLTKNTFIAQLGSAQTKTVGFTSGFYTFEIAKAAAGAGTYTTAMISACKKYCAPGSTASAGPVFLSRWECDRTFPFFAALVLRAQCIATLPHRL